MVKGRRSGSPFGKTVSRCPISTMFFWNNKLYFNPNDGVNGYELWSY
jgi:hypothetical protein